MWKFSMKSSANWEKPFELFRLITMECDDVKSHDGTPQLAHLLNIEGIWWWFSSFGLSNDMIGQGIIVETLFYHFVLTWNETFIVSFVEFQLNLGAFIRSELLGFSLSKYSTKALIQRYSLRWRRSVDWVCVLMSRGSSEAHQLDWGDRNVWSVHAG